MPEKNASCTFRDEKIFSDGVHLVPMEITKEGGEIVLMWVVAEFDGDCFIDGGSVTPKESSDNFDDLLNGGEAPEEYHM